MYAYEATVDRVVDGDTLYVTVRLGFHISTRQCIRLYGIDTPELRGDERAAGLKAKARVVELLDAADRITIRTHKQGKYGRYLAEITVYAAGGESYDLNARLVKEGFATLYLP